jgi:hypothetical protein
MPVEDTWNKERGYNEPAEHYVIRSFMICTPTKYSWVVRSRRTGWVWHVAYGGEMKHTQGLVGKPEEKKQFPRPR